MAFDAVAVITVMHTRFYQKKITSSQSFVEVSYLIISFVGRPFLHLWKGGGGAGRHGADNGVQSAIGGIMNGPVRRAGVVELAARGGLNNNVSVCTLA